MQIGDIYLYSMRDLTLVLWARHYIIWAELSVSHFYNAVTTGNGHKNVLKFALWYLFSIQSSEYGATTISLFST